MEKCKQCGSKSDVPFPIVAIMAFGPMETAEWVLKVNDAVTFAAWPICRPCHSAPKLKAHFTYREIFQEALRRAGSSNLG
jgi:hypothetical protein